MHHEVPMVLHRPHDQMVDDGDCDDDDGGDDDDDGGDDDDDDGGDDVDADGFTETSRSNGGR